MAIFAPSESLPSPATLHLNSVQCEQWTMIAELLQLQSLLKFDLCWEFQQSILSEPVFDDEL